MEMLVQRRRKGVARITWEQGQGAGIGGWDRGAGMEEQRRRGRDRDCMDGEATTGLQGWKKRHTAVRMQGWGLQRWGIGEEDWWSGAGEKGIHVVYGKTGMEEQG